MFKFVALWNIKPGISEEDFERWYAEQHMGDAKRIPRLIKYTVNLVDTPDNSPSRYYRMAELCFRTREDFEKAFISPEWKHAFVDAQSYITDHLRLQFTSQDVPLEKEQIKK